METNPRARMPGEWAPPPPIVVPPAPVRQVPRPVVQEKEFEDILGNLVEHYAALPPPAFGESPGLEETTATTHRVHRVGAWVWAATGVALLGGVAGALVLSGVVNLRFPGLARDNPTVVPVKAVPAVAPALADVKIKINEPPPPMAEPLEVAVPAVPVVAKPEPARPEPATVMSRVSPRKAKPRHVRRVKRQKARRMAASPQPMRRGKADDEWADPYQ